MVEKKYTLQFTEKEIRILINMINNENAQVVADGTARVETIKKFIGAIQEQGEKKWV